MAKKIVLALCAVFLLTSAPALADDDRRGHRGGGAYWYQGHDGKHGGRHWDRDRDRDRGGHHKRWKKHDRWYGKHGRAVVIWHGHRHWAPQPKRHFHYHRKPAQRHHHNHYDRRSSRDSWALYAILALQLVDRLNESQQQHYAWAQQRAVAVPIGETIEWQDSGIYGSVTPTREGADGSGRYCREFQHQITVGRQQQSGYGVACRQPDGAWEIVS